MLRHLWKVRFFVVDTVQSCCSAEKDEYNQQVLPVQAPATKGRVPYQQ